MSSKKSSSDGGKRKRFDDGKRKRDDKKPAYFKNKGKPAPLPLTGKAAKRQRQLEKPHGEKVVQAKVLWNKLRDPNVETEQRKALVADIMTLLGSNLWEIVARHDASRVIQSCFRYGEIAHQTLIMSAIENKIYDLTTTQYGHHLIKCVLRHGTTVARNRVIHELSGKVVKLCTHATGSSVLELLYNGYQGRAIATKAQVSRLFKECYGREFLVFCGDAASLQIFLDRNPERTENVMGDMSNLCERIITKGYHRFGYSHWLLAEYFSHCGPARMSAIVPSIVEATMHLASTPLGTRVLCDSLVAGGAKERKKIVKFFRGNSVSIANHECGHIVLMRALDVVDDTVLMRKAVMQELAESCIDLCLDRHGYLVIMQLLVPNHGRYVTNAKHLALLTTVSETSKKSPEVRRNEHLKTLREPLIKGCVDRCEELLREDTGRSILLEVVRQFHPPTLCLRLGQILGSLVSHEEDEKEENEEEEEEEEDEDEKMVDASKVEEEEEESMTLETFELQRLTKDLLVCEEEQRQEDEKSEATFTTTFWTASEGYAIELASKNRTAYVIEKMLKGTIVSDDVKKSLQDGESVIRIGLKNAPKSESIKAVLSIAFPSSSKTNSKKKAGGKKKAAPAKAKKAAPAKAKKAPAKKAPAKKEPAAKKTSAAKKTAAAKKKDKKEPTAPLRRSTRSRKGSI